MKILIDIGHPAHVHYFRNLYHIMRSKGHHVMVIARDKELTYQLLEAYDIPFLKRGKGGQTYFGKILYLFKANIIVYKAAKQFNPDIFLSFSSPYAAQVSYILGKPHIALDDTEHALLGRLFYYPFTESVLSPESYNRRILKKQTTFNGYLELCYLHSNYYKPDDSIFDSIPIDKNDPFVVIRFVIWNANHDIGRSGLDLEVKRKAIEEFSKYAKVFISSEAELPADMKPYELNIPPHKIHDLLFYASLCYSESATMASESAILGTPAIYLDDRGRGYTDDLEKNFGLVFNYSLSTKEQYLSIQKGIDILRNSSNRTLFKQKRENLLKEKVDVTRYLIECVENYKL